MSSTGRDTTWVASEFDRRADRYDESGVHHWQAERAALLLAPRCGQRLLDIATGTGLAARACADLTGAANEIIGIDVSLQMLRAAARRSTSHYVQADATRLPFRVDSFDALICVAAIPYFPDLNQAVIEWRRVARPNATLVFTTPAADGVTGLRLLRRAAEEHGIDLPDPHAGLGDVQHLAEQLTRLGLAADRIEQQAFPEQLADDPRATFNTVIDYGFAEPLRYAHPELRERVFASFGHVYQAERTACTAAHVVMFTRCHIPD